MPLPKVIERGEVLSKIISVMIYHMNFLKRYTLLSLLLLLSIITWGQAENNLKHLTSKDDSKVLRGNSKGISTQLTVHPEAKALLQKIAKESKSTQQQPIDALSKLLGESAAPPPVALKGNDKQKDLIIKRDKQNVPIFIKGKNKQVLTAHKATNSRRKDQLTTATTFLQEYKTILQLKDPITEFKELTNTPDKQGNTHIKLQQYWNDLPIWGSEIIVHTNAKGVYAFNGRYHPSPNIPLESVTISAATATEIVHKIVGKDKFVLPEQLRKILPTTAEKEPTLLYYFKESSNTFELAWKVEFHTKDHEEWLFMIDVQDGTVLKKLNQACSFHGPTTTTAKDLNGVTQTVNTYDNGQYYYLIDGSKPMFDPNSTVPGGETGAIITLDWQLSDELQDIHHVLSTDNTFTNQAAISAHHHAGICYDYFYYTFGRNSIDGKGGNITSVINDAVIDNAYWSSEYRMMFYGNGKDLFRKGSLARSLDASAHEMTHGVVQSSSGLIYQFQSGALNESFADIFGAMVDRDDWTIGETVVNPDAYRSGAMRNMEDPSNGVARGALGWQPSHMSEYRCLAEYEDAGGVHMNSGIPNHAFYLFAKAVGKDKAEQVYYKALTQYLTNRAQFLDCRYAVIYSADELYDDSVVAAATAAFDAVGITENISFGCGSRVAPVALDEQYILTKTKNRGQAIMGEVNLQNDFYRVKSTTDFNPRLSVERTGRAAVFVGEDRHVYITDLTDNNPETNTKILFEATGTQWYKVTVNSDFTKFALLTYPHEPSLIIYDAIIEKSKTFDIYSPASQAGQLDDIPEYLDMINFDPTGQFVLYDAYNKRDNGKGFWDIGVINVWNNRTRNFGTGRVFKPAGTPLDGYLHGNPIFSNLSNDLIAFEEIDEKREISRIILYNFLKDEAVTIAINNFYSDYSLSGAPCFSPNDNFIAYVTDRGETENYITLQRIRRNYVSIIGDNISRFFGEFPMWYATQNNSFSSQADQLFSFADINNEPISLTVESTTPIKIEVPPVYTQDLTVAPNPVQSVTTLQYELTAPTAVTLNLYDLTGKKIKTIVNQVPTEIGHHQQQLDLSNFSSGTYLVVLQTAFELTTQKIVLK